MINCEGMGNCRIEDGSGINLFAIAGGYIFPSRDGRPLKKITNHQLSQLNFFGADTAVFDKGLEPVTETGITIPPDENAILELATGISFSPYGSSPGSFLSEIINFVSSDKLPSSGKKSKINHFRHWTLPPDSELEILISRAGKMAEEELYAENILGGGLPPAELITAFHKIVLAGWRESSKWTDSQITDLYQYPQRGGADRHRAAILNKFLGENERNLIKMNFSSAKNGEADGLFFTYGSQEALYLMGKILVEQEEATKENPVELCITDPVYPGLLMALDEFLKAGSLKLRVVPVTDKGEIYIPALRQAMNNERCPALYISEGNPIPVKISNLRQVAELFEEEEFQDKIVFEDRAYKDLGGTEQPLFDLLPDRVVAFETFSKKGAPLRLGIVYSNMTEDRFVYVRNNMLKHQYNHSLGFSGLIGGLAYGILNNEKVYQRYLKHLQRVKKYYEGKRKIYTKYEKALNLAFGKGNYNLEEEVTIGDQYFMFGWRWTPVPADLYVKAGKKIGLYSLSGNACRPKAEYITGDIPETDSDHRLRQNYTWIPITALEIAIYKDVLLEVIFSDLSPSDKEAAVNRLVSRIDKISMDNPRTEVYAFVEKVKDNNWEYTESLFE